MISLPLKNFTVDLIIFEQVVFIDFYASWVSASDLNICIMSFVGSMHLFAMSKCGIKNI